MINRELIRLKTVQEVYAYYVGEGTSQEAAVKELFVSLGAAYELYERLLVLIINVTDVAARKREGREARRRALGDRREEPRKFVDNRFVAQLRANKQLRGFRERLQHTWLDERGYLNRLVSNIEARDFFVDYMNSEEDSYEADRELWRKIYRNVVAVDEELDELLEGMGIYWNDDKPIVDTFVVKTIKRFDEAKGEEQELLPDFDSEEDKEFAKRLLEDTLEHGDYYRELIAGQAKNWEVGRLARMDLFVMQTALAEIFTFPGIPLTVSISEYVEITKAYSTPKSGAYVNGVLDSLCRRLNEEGVIKKTFKT